MAGGDFYRGLVIPELLDDCIYFSLILSISLLAYTNTGTNAIAFIDFYLY